jgi:hypothetical protein
MQSQGKRKLYFLKELHGRTEGDTVTCSCLDTGFGLLNGLTEHLSLVTTCKYKVFA